MKKLLTLTLLLSLTILTFNLYSQSTAMDFEQNDCSGTPHHLFSELDAGKVLVLEFIMLNCAPCIVATKALEDIVAPYEQLHPGRVAIYSVGFLNSYTCDQLNKWISNNSFDHPIFSDGESQVNYYGGMGMPTIIVLGTNEHKVFYNGIGYTASHDALIRAAIDSALLYNPAGIGEELALSSYKVYPTVFTDRIVYESEEYFAGTELVIFNTLGWQVQSFPVTFPGRMSILTEGLPKGIYIARLRDNQGVTGGIRLIKQ